MSPVNDEIQNIKSTLKGFYQPEVTDTQDQFET